MAQLDDIEVVVSVVKNYLESLVAACQMSNIQVIFMAGQPSVSVMVCDMALL